jgi:hypothetical protein
VSLLNLAGAFCSAVLRIAASHVSLLPHLRLPDRACAPHHTSCFIQLPSSHKNLSNTPKMIVALVADKLSFFKSAQHEGRIISCFRRKVVPKHRLLSTIQQACQLCYSSSPSFLPLLWRAKITLILKSFFPPISPQDQSHWAIPIDPNSARTPTSTAAATHHLGARGTRSP